MKPCKWRGALKGGLYPCSSARLIGVGNGVTPEFCETRCPYVDHEIFYRNAVPRVGQCVHLGSETGRRIECGPCAGRVQVKVSSCGKHGECVRGETIENVRGCRACTDYAKSTPLVLMPLRTVRLDVGQLARAHDGRLHNPSLLHYHGRRLLCYRAGQAGSSLHVATLGDDWQPVRSVQLTLQHPRCDGGREDPRLFIHEGRLHVQFAGIEMVDGRLRVNIMLALLDDDLVVVRVWEAGYAERTWIEKNWGPFSFRGELLTVYSIRPHRVLESSSLACSEGPLFRVAYETDGPPAWIGGELFRGGAPPVRVGDEFVSFFHSWGLTGSGPSQWYDYAIGVYTFDAWPPFAARRASVGPILRGDRLETARNTIPDKNVVFPCGVMLCGADWVVSYGHQDSWCELAFFPVADVTRALRPVQRPRQE